MASEATHAVIPH